MHFWQPCHDVIVGVRPCRETVINCCSGPSVEFRRKGWSQAECQMLGYVCMHVFVMREKVASLGLQMGRAAERCLR